MGHAGKACQSCRQDREDEELMPSEKVSVIIPTHNRAFHLAPCIDSVLAQTYPVHEIIVVDDGSTDETAEAIQSCISERRVGGKKIKYFYQPNQGQSVAYNNGIARATGNWIAFQNSDDLWLPQKLEWQFRALEKYKYQCGLCFTDAWFMNNPYRKTTVFQYFGNQGHESLGIICDPVRLIVNHNWVWCQTVIVRTDLARSVGGFDPFLRFSEDRDFLFRAALVSKFCFLSMPMVLIDRSPSALRLTGGANWDCGENWFRMEQYRVEKQLSLAGELEPDIRESARKNLRSIHGGLAGVHLQNGELAKARESLSNGARYGLDLRIVLGWVLARLGPTVARKMMELRSRQRKAIRHDMIEAVKEIQ